MKIFERLFFEGVWECYYRKIKNESVIDSKKIRHDWYKIRVPRRYWCADPFIVSDKGKSYIFCELMDRKISRGLLGIGEILDNMEVKISILTDLGCHTSYPDVFKVEATWYMIPETVDRKTIELYKAVSFPFKWEKVSDLLQGINAVDTTAFIVNKEIFLFIYEDQGINNTLSIAKFDQNTLKLVNRKIVMNYTSKIGRPGGKIIYKNGHMLRPTQYGVNHYGEALVLKDFEFILNDYSYKEKDSFMLWASDVLPKEIANKINGLHTYNSSDEYEIIDVQRKKCFIERPIVALLKKLKIGGYKYYVRKR